MKRRGGRIQKKPAKPKPSSKHAASAQRRKPVAAVKQHKSGPAPIVFDLKKVQALSAKGLTQEQVAISLGVSARTVSSRLADDADFADAYKKGEAAGIQTISNALFQNATKSKQVAAQIFFLKARAGWRDRVEVTGAGGQPLIPNNLKLEEKLARAQKLLEAAQRVAAANKG